MGYLVSSFNDFIRGYLSFRVIVQSSNYDPNKLDERIELFLDNFRNFIANMDNHTFELNKNSVINNLLKKPKTIFEH